MATMIRRCPQTGIYETVIVEDEQKEATEDKKPVVEEVSQPKKTVVTKR